MKGMLKAEKFKFLHSYSLWIIIGVLLICCGISIITGTYSSAEDALNSLSKDSMVPILACAIFSASILTEDFSNGLLRHFISNGYKRSFIIMAKFIHYMAGCGILLFVYPLVSVVLAAGIQGLETSFLAILISMLLSIFRSIPLYFGVFSVFFLFSVWSKKGTIAMGVSVAFSILIVIFTNKFYSAGNLLRYSPIIQLGQSNDVSEYFISVGISMVVLVICLCSSVIRFNRDEL